MTIHRLLWCLSVVAILIGVSRTACADERPAPQKVVTIEGITEYHLDNGLRVLLFPDQSRPTVTVNMTVLIGSRHEGYGEAGMAHLLEHMVFKGTPLHPNIPQALQDRGARFNGTTTPDRTNYFETVPASEENLEFCLRLEADRLVHSPIRQADLDAEFTVVRNEFERSENAPLGVLAKRIAAAAYEWHNYGKSTLGNRSDIERVPVAHLRAFYQKYYQPDNVVLVVAGHFDEAQALDFIQQSFGVIPRPARQLDTTYTEEPPQDGERLVTLRRVGDVGAVDVAYHIPAGPHEDFAPLQVLANILSTPPSGRLNKLLVETQLATQVFAAARGQHDPGLMRMQATVRDPQVLDNVRDLMLDAVEQIGATGVTAEEVTRAKQQLLKARELAAADTSQIALALSEWAAQGDWRLYFLARDRIEQITPESVQAVAARYLQRNNRTVGMFIPADKPELIAIPHTPDVQALVAAYQGRTALAASELFDATPANIEARVQRQVLPEGITVTLLPKPSRGEEVYLTLTLRYGDAESLKGFEAANGFLGDLMLRGTQKMSYQRIRDELDKLQATLSAGGGGGRGGPVTGGTLGAVSFAVQAKRDTLPAVLDILRQVLREPVFPVRPFEIMQRARLASLEQMRTDPGMLAARLLQRHLAPYPQDDVRYVPTIDEAITRVQAVTRDQVAQLYRVYLGSQAGELAIVGDFDPDACLPILQATFAGWTATKPYARIATSAPSGLTGVQQQIKTPDKANATYASGLAFPLRDDDPEYPALVIANVIYGGSTLASRLATRVRQHDGLSYGVGSSFSASSFDPRATITTNAICNPQNIGKVTQAIAEELAWLLRDGVTADELTQVKHGYLQAQKVARASDAALARILTNLSHVGRTMTYTAEVETKIAALTPEQVNAAMRKHLDPQALVIVTAGDFDVRTTGGLP
jgi:zinc protease